MNLTYLTKRTQNENTTNTAYAVRLSASGLWKL